MSYFSPCIPLKDASGWSKRPGNVTSPYLLCHEPNLLSVRWDPPFPGLVYVLEYSDTSDSWQPIQTTRFTTVTLVDLTPETRYQIRITGMASDGQIGEPALSECVSTLPANVVPDTVEDIYVQHIKVKENKVTVNITWVPALDQACFYEVAAFPDNIPDYNIEEVEPQRLFTVLMDMQFNNEYNVTIRSQRRDKTLSSQPAWILYNVPTCLELHNYNISVCAPPEPVNITVRETWSPMSEPNVILYDVSVTWALPILPTDQQQINLEEIKYILTFQRKIPVAEEEKHIKTLTVPGNMSSAVFYGVDVGMVYMVSIVAQSRGGESEAINKFRQIEAFNNTQEEGAKLSFTFLHEEFNPSGTVLLLISSSYLDLASTPINKVSKWSTVKIVMIIMIPMLVLGGLTVLIVLAYNRFEKARRNKKRSNYFKDLDSSDGRSKERGVTPSPLVKDEWETCLSQLIMGDVLGEGAFGVVCKGLLQDKSREDRWHEVAVKMLKDHPLEEDVQSFQEEIKMMKSVGRHPNIVSIIGCCTQVGKMRLIVEYCSLGDLKKYLRNVWDNIVSAPYPAEVCLANASTNDPLQQVKYAELVHSD
uniref:(California timema) hypothetical protein n=1 Tax=Timema californicum TaxID=61474 RepID=A0A7R9P6X0_TIMCA|nr:unnamed protein product [Timema californicum]